MYVLTVARPLGELVATNQVTLLCSDRPFPVFPQPLLIRNASGVLPHDDATFERWARAREDGAVFGAPPGGPDLEVGYDRPGQIAALVLRPRYGILRSWTAEDVLRATSLRITQRTQAEILHLYGPKEPRFVVRLLGVRPIRPHETMASLPGLVTGSRLPSLANWLDRERCRYLSETADPELVAPDPVIAGP